MRNPCKDDAKNDDQVLLTRRIIKYMDTEFVQTKPNEGRDPAEEFRREEYACRERD